MGDVAKAFDKVWHAGLKFKILNLNIHNIFKSVLCNLFDNRTAQIKMGMHTGSSFGLHSGAPQGSCLSPALFSLNGKLEKVKRAMLKLKNFSCFRNKIKPHLYKALVLPHLDYSPVPTNISKPTVLQIFQSLQNKSIRWVNGDVPPYNNTAESIYRIYNLIPFNQWVFIQADNTRHKIRRLCPQRTFKSINEQHIWSHHWWPLSFVDEHTRILQPKYIQPRR